MFFISELHYQTEDDYQFLVCHVLQKNEVAFLGDALPFKVEDK